MGIESNAPVLFLRQRCTWMSLAATLIFAILAARLWYLQVIKTEDFTALSERNRTRYIPVAPPRGPIFDRNSTLLVENRPAFGVSALRSEIDDSAVLSERLAKLTGVPAEELRRRLAAGKKLPAYQPVSLVDDIGRDAMELIQEQGIYLPGVFIEVRPVRSYTRGSAGAHLFGYIGAISERDLQGGRADTYRIGDLIGRSGLEKHLEEYLRGAGGEKRVEVDARGRELRQLKALEPVPGKKVYLSIDIALQEAAEKAFGDQSGAAVALDVNTGEVLAMASRPGFDPALFASGITAEAWKNLLTDPQHPLQNRAIQGQYPPGSTFKIVTALSALEAGVATPSTTVQCNGIMTLGDREIRCWKKEGHGSVDLKKALRESCDIWFYQVGLRLGIDQLSTTALNFGLGQPLGFPLDGEKKGLIPTRQWKKRRFGQNWYDGETAIAAIGQGYVLATPLQLAVMTAAVANGGAVLQPQVVRRIEELDGTPVFTAQPKVLRTLELDSTALTAVRRGLEAVVNEPGGTAAVCRLSEVRVAGKTGTAQVVKRKDDKDKSAVEDPRQFRDHALFVAYAPAERPQVAVAVVVEHGGHGGTTAAPIARAMLRRYFGLADETAPVPNEVTSGD